MARSSYPLFLILLGVAAALAALPSVWSGFHGDDYIVFGVLSGALRKLYPSRLDVFNFCDGTADHVRRMVDVGILPWWTADTFRVAFWRPLSALTHWLQRNRRSPVQGTWRWLATVAVCILMGLHLLVSPYQLFRIASESDDRTDERVADSISTDPSLRGQGLIIMSAPTTVLVFHWFFVRALRGQPIPEYTRLLASGPVSLELYRPDSRSVRVRWRGHQEPGFGVSRPFAVGERIRLASTDVEITATDTMGWPSEAVFRFDVNLDDPRLRWVTWDGDEGRFTQLAPPRIGATSVVP